jgi:hypothetical protein
MTTEELVFMAGFAEGLRGTVQTKTPIEARRIGEMMLELVREIARERNIELPGGSDNGA